MPFKFEKLEVWKEAVELSGLVHRICLSFPKDELHILTPQLKRATDSISLNIAEGSTGQSDAEFKKFLGYALRSGTLSRNEILFPIKTLMIFMNLPIILLNEFKP